MKLVARLAGFNRVLRLRRQLNDIQRVIEALPPRMHPQLAFLVRRELDLAAQSDDPQLYGTPPEAPITAYTWGIGNDIGLARAKSESIQTRMRGVALWVAVVFHETRGSKEPQLLALHRNIITLLKQFREATAPVDATVQWMKTSAIA
jgi:hypothetical protein